MDQINISETLSPLYNNDHESRIKALFTNIFIQQNRIQTAYERISADISTKQWLLIGMTVNCPEPKTLTRVGQLMGCSRQNVKQLAEVLAAKGYINIVKGKSRCVCLELTEKANRYYDEIYNSRKEFLNKLYGVFTEDELIMLYNMQTKLFKGIELAEKYAFEQSSSQKQGFEKDPAVKL
ncbi:MAG: MarR family winged helix-turn-helix transcriptional regulator [Oscillospiraceae bacterium]